MMGRLYMMNILDMIRILGKLGYMLLGILNMNILGMDMMYILY